MKDRECIHCENQMKEAWINTGMGTLILEPQIKGLKKVCGIKVYVCSNCGHIELVAENTELFK